MDGAVSPPEIPVRSASVREVGPRDGLQSEAPVPVEARARLISMLSRTGLRRIEAVSFVSPRAVPAMAHAAEVWSRVERSPDVAYSALVPNRRGAEAALEVGVDDFDASIGGLGGSPFAPAAGGNVATEDLVHMLEDMGIATGVSVEALLEAATEVAAMVGHAVASRVSKAGPRWSVRA